jgi:hypothetical protein
MVKQQEGQHFPENLALEEGAFLVHELPKPK